ncbi:helix-turn-helix domain-containing protein [Bittarella massiliensis (ex Durand et al. 2017)]|uniref:Helix-turn-helix domain-containing protein n=1 Tax=Bittarella massiliensis (ex Durand et al. 2017) TaxID=1720313 RepID=A0AAW5KF42_9FIRM|nr:helix-turn-helix transcriptional regulator [Bittarella massiliensis (ex Durand et al. 2017)]MCQ4949559.1 helix-turn-helix domain-containing protein [Bittarella massiliensis (ex Durand et al. 2017)]
MKNRQLADQLTALRRDAGLSQEELAARLGVSRPAVSRWERGAALPGVENLTALAALYGVGAEELLAAPGPAAPAQPSPRRRQSAKGPVYGLLGLSLALRLAATVWNNLEIRKVSFWKCPQIRHFSRFVQTIGLISPCRIGIMMTIILG